MQSILDKDRYSSLPFHQRRDLNAAERAAHDSVRLLFDYLSVYLQPQLADKALNVVIVGVVSGLARVLAEHRSAKEGAGYIEGVAAILPAEFEAWLSRPQDPAEMRH